MKVQNQSLRSLYGATAIAGIIGAVTLDLKLILWNHVPVPGLWQGIASQAVGPVAQSSQVYALLGAAMHLAISLFWAFAYLFVWSRVNSLKNWIVGGLVWGIVVMVGMLCLLHFKSQMPWPAFNSVLLDSAIGHTVFFGLPVAWYIARSARAR